MTTFVSFACLAGIYEAKIKLTTHKNANSPLQCSH